MRASSSQKLRTILQLSLRQDQNYLSNLGQLQTHSTVTHTHTSAAVETAVPRQHNIASTCQAQLQQPEPEIPPNDSNMNEGGEDASDHVPEVSADGDSVSGGEVSSEEDSDVEDDSEIEAQVDALLGGYEVKSPEVSAGDDDDEIYVPAEPSVPCPATLPHLHTCVVDLLCCTLANCRAMILLC
jgi:hypothetical protein